MAHFAELNSSNEVIQVVVISNDDVNSNGGDYSSEAETFVSNLIPHSENGVAWKQTSYNGNHRKQFAGIVLTYDPLKNKFILPQPFNSWSLDSNDDWQAPITYPTVTDDGEDHVVSNYDIKTNETKYQADNTTCWEATKSNDESETPTKLSLIHN